MENELKQIKKLYGEELARFCRDNFSTILEKEGVLFEILTTHFEPTHFLYHDIVESDAITEFKDYIYGLVNVITIKEKNVCTTAEQLMDEAGYNLYECTTEEEVQSFKKYYAYGEELCTFNGNRLNSCRVFFAVKKNVDEIKREDFINPERQDEYGTSVISIQLTKDGTNTLSIKNRYNHTVKNPDATYSNNLDNIIEGLTNAFEKDYGIVQKYRNSCFEIGGYVIAEGKYFKYNYEIDNIYYCPNNIIIDDFKVKRYEKEKYIVFDYFVLSLIDKKVLFLDGDLDEGTMDFIKSINRLNIEKISIERKGKNKIITITPYFKEDIIIELDQYSRMIKLIHPHIVFIREGFLYYSEYLKVLKLSNLKSVENVFLGLNDCLEEFVAPNLKSVGFCFLYNNLSLKKLSLPSLKETGSGFLDCNVFLKELSLPNLESVLDEFLRNNVAIKNLCLPKLKTTGMDFFFCNTVIKDFDFPSLEKVGANFLCNTMVIEKFSAPKLTEIDEKFLYNYSDRYIYMPKNEKTLRKIVNSLEW